MKEENYKSMALICKTPKECIKLKKKLEKKSKVEIDIINDKDDTYEAGVVILPSYLAKGLEFDIVFIVNIDEKNEESEMGLKLLYVAMTRTLHCLYVYQQNDSITVLDKIDNNFYNNIN
jgi:DNA helicase-2/ATP-dependent DNA helicase PcrA